MSLFNKPKRNIRRRNVDEEEDNENRSLESDGDRVNTKNKLKKDKPKQTLLSFGEELEEADDGEVFKVKKSSRSRRLMKQLDQERKKKKGEDKVHIDNDSSSISGSRDLEIKTDDLVVKIKNTGPLILNGRDAVTAGKDDYTSEDEDESESSRNHQFKKQSSKPENMKFFLQSGCIPDAAMIHAARKRRQKARETGQDYIPVEEQSNDNDSRLRGEDDDNHSDDEDYQERINMTVNTAELDKEKRRQAFIESQESLAKHTDTESEPELEEWETQQIRKGVTGAQLAAAHQDSMMQFGSLITESGIPMSVPNVPSAPAPPVIQAPNPSQCVPITTEEVLSKIRERLNTLREVHRRHELNYESVQLELIQSKKEVKEGESRAPEMAQRYNYYQKLRGYISDLVECLNEKFPQIVALETRWVNLYGDKAVDLIDRRRQDVKDELDEVMATGKGQLIRRDPKDDARVRRTAEREGRRARRRRTRELNSVLTKHMDGMSSDDEVTEQQNLVFKQAKDEIERESRELLLDVEDDFSSIKNVLKKLDDWRRTDYESYTEAYVPLCIPKIISPLVRLQLVTWNPIMESSDLERSKWYNSLATYALDSKQTDDSSKPREPDVRLIPSVIEKVVIPKLTTIIENIWDPLSTSQTLRLVGIVNKFIRDYPNLNESSSQVLTLFMAILTKIQGSIENDVYIPMYDKQTMDTKFSVFFQRQFFMAMKLLRNVLSWQGLISDEKLKDIAFGSILNRYLLHGLRGFSTPDALVKANMIMSMIPRAWLQGEPISKLEMFAKLVQQLADQLDQANPAHNEAWEYSKSILKTLKPLLSKK